MGYANCVGIDSNPMTPTAKRTKTEATAAAAAVATASATVVAASTASTAAAPEVAVAQQQHTQQQHQNQQENQSVREILLSSKEAAVIVREFVLLKAFDVVSSGQYRKFVLRKKDLCEGWAMRMHDNYHAMTVEVRNLAKYVSMARSQGHMEVATVCTKLLNCLECPHVHETGWNTCSITKVQCVGGVRVNAMSEATPIFVHPRFLRFCLSFWYTSRFDHVLRRVVRGKYTKIFCDDYTLSQVSAMIYADTDIVTGVVDNFIHALTHVHATMHKFLGIPARGSETLSNFVI